ncbi:MAG: hypothetical protein JW825_02600 [Candidatus Methanofastidiosa archaeon]|nr:hypothetical protein [Candidatus Methanofastidiosa archaeon]
MANEEIKREIVYFSEAGKGNTGRCIELAVERAKELGIKDFVVASTSGFTANVLYEKLRGEGNIVVVTHMVGFKEIGVDRMAEDARLELVMKGMKVLTTGHALSGAERGIKNKLGLLGPLELMANTLRMVSHGVKVAMEITLMASDSGLIPMDKEIMSIGGTGSGADTACVVSPAHTNNCFDFKYHEIVCMPR